MRNMKPPLRKREREKDESLVNTTTFGVNSFSGTKNEPMTSNSKKDDSNGLSNFPNESGIGRYKEKTGLILDDPIDRSIEKNKHNL